jgi:hydantoinase/carbamoylase family amidase
MTVAQAQAVRIGREGDLRVILEDDFSTHMLRDMALDPARTVAELRELQELTGDENGAQRVAWTETWERAREWLRGKLAGLPLDEQIDQAGNQWFTLPGQSQRQLLIGGHIDSVPNGGWLDGCLNLMAGVEVVRRLAEGGAPAVTVRLVNWADEEGARFGRSLFGSSAACGSMQDQDELRELTDRDGISLPDALAQHGVDLDRATEAREQLENAAAYLELHIEQGPVLEGLELPLGAVLGTFGVERHRITWTGQAAHAGSTPMDRRRDALAGAAKLALEIRDIARRVGGGAVCTSGGVVCKPGIVTSVVETAEQLLDQRHLDADRLAELLAQAKEAAARFAEEENIEAAWERIWSIEPILFDSELVDMCDAAIEAVAGRSHRLPSGPLHDAAEVSRAGIPTVMMFVQSLRGLSHTKLEDTKPEHIELSVAALDRLTDDAISWVAAWSQ